MALVEEPTSLPGVVVVKPAVFKDARGYFLESYNFRDFNAAIGEVVEFVQDNHSRSSRGALRGIHYQIKNPQGKLVRVTAGAAFDVAVDLRQSSPYFGKWFGLELSEDNHKQLWIPPGFGHGFLALSETVDFLYKTTEYRFVEHERTVRWDDPSLAIAWPEVPNLLLKDKDRDAPLLVDAEYYP
jgi:dTDP-4-dehydrorhamnose 3,5-epimerase